MTDALRRLIETNTLLQSPEFVPEIRLRLADEPFGVWKQTEDLAGRELPPPFWAFAWAGGLALARFVLDHPEFVVGRRVLDFASGSGIVAIAAALAGAAVTVANDIDECAAAAIALNAAANGVSLRIDTSNWLVSEGAVADVVLAGDVFYERALGEQVWAFLRRVGRDGATVLVGDLGRAYLPKEGLAACAAYDVPVGRALEDAPIKQTTIWRLASD
ncbi:MAG: 50S ribosomal protein L11 methyltransferase [Dehalococcoidia bacterium]